MKKQEEGIGNSSQRSHYKRKVRERSIPKGYLEVQRKYFLFGLNYRPEYVSMPRGQAIKKKRWLTGYNQVP